MNFRIRLLSIALLSLFACGCGKKADDVPATPDPGEVSKVMLNEGKGAILFVFPQFSAESREDWFTIINLVGNTNTDTLPRIPFADLSATLLLNVPVGMYSVQAAASIRGNPPYAGGKLNQIVVVPGTVAVLQVEKGGTDSFPFSNTPMKRLSQPTWTLQNREGIMNYITDISRSAARG